MIDIVAKENKSVRSGSRRSQNVRNIYLSLSPFQPSIVKAWQQLVESAQSHLATSFSAEELNQLDVKVYRQHPTDIKRHARCNKDIAYRSRTLP